MPTYVILVDSEVPPMACIVDFSYKTASWFELLPDCNTADNFHNKDEYLVAIKKLIKDLYEKWKDVKNRKEHGLGSIRGHKARK